VWRVERDALQYFVSAVAARAQSHRHRSLVGGILPFPMHVRFTFERKQLLLPICNASSAADLSNLTVLELPKSNISDIGVKFLNGTSDSVCVGVPNEAALTIVVAVLAAALVRVPALDFSNSALSDDGFAELSGTITSVCTSSRPLSTHLIADIVSRECGIIGLSRLTALSLANTNVTDRSLVDIAARLPALEQLALDRTNVTTAAVSALKGTILSFLRSIWLDDD
jgi:hypothetical protein